MSIALVGTRGVPARYGGFETCVEEVGARLVERGHHVRVYSRNGNRRPGDSRSYRGMELVHRRALRKRSLETLSSTGLSVAHLVRHRTDAAIVFNSANAPWLPALRLARVPVATHVDGLEWQRAKWGPVGSRYYRGVESLAVRWSDALIADAKGIADYYLDRFGISTDLIAYGAPKICGVASDRLAELDLVAGKFHLVVARFEAENHVDMIVDGYRRSTARLPLIVVGSAPYADGYTKRVRSLADDRVRFLGGLWDQELLDQLYAHASTYVHGHSVGGTNPSLLRAIGAGTATLAFDVVFNREVLAEAGLYFSSASEICRLFSEIESNPAEIKLRGSAALVRSSLYEWDSIADSYEQLCHRLMINGRRYKPNQASALPKIVEEVASPGHSIKFGAN